MIDFRYHLISLIGIILALALGILAGSGFLGGPILENLKRNVEGLEETNERLREDIASLDERLEQADAFAREAEPLLIQGALAGEEIVLFQFEGTEGRLVDGIRRVVDESGGEITSEITLTDKLWLQSAPARDELSLILGSFSGRPRDLRVETGTLLGQRAAAAAAEQDTSEARGAQQRLQLFLDELERAEFAGVGTTDDATTVPPGASFLVVGGNDQPSQFEMGSMGVALVEGLTEGGGVAVVVVESSDSLWGLVTAVRQDVETRSGASTVDNGDTIVGQIAAVLSLEPARTGDVGHWGVREGRTGIFPPAQPAS